MKKKSEYDPRPIGIFDSGIGGLTVVRQLMEVLPEESIVYFGDTARIPYGTKSEEIVRRFALEDSVFLLEHDVKMIVVACNTASSIAVPFLESVLPVPVIGMIEPGAEAAVRYSRKARIGVIGTPATIRSDSYRVALQKIDANVQVISQPCPLFVPLVEEGLIEDEATYLIARRYLQPLKDNQVDTLILGCTHYPILKDVIQRIMGNGVVLVDSGVEAARRVKKLLEERKMSAPPGNRPTHRFYLSDLPYKFQEIAERYLNRTLPHVETVDFEKFLMKKGETFWNRFFKTETTP